MNAKLTNTATILLQWGHVFSDVETSFAQTFIAGQIMLQWGHVFSDVETPEV